jgi:hypothetical protein
LGDGGDKTEIWHGNCFLLQMGALILPSILHQAMLVQACSSLGHHWNLHAVPNGLICSSFICIHELIRDLNIQLFLKGSIFLMQIERDS